MKVKTQEPTGFSDFWQIWRPHMRHTDGRGDARERYRKELLKGAEPEDIIDGAKAYIRHLLSLPKDKQEFIPLAATWLHKQSFLDWCEHERSYQERINAPRDNVVSITAPKPKWLQEWEARKASQ